MRLVRLHPLAPWLRNYDRADLGSDVSAGLTVAVMLVPQAMAYALLAGLPPVVGLYASAIPLFVYSLFGSSRQLAVGPVAMVSLLVAASVGQIATPGSPEAVALAITLAALVGVMQAGMGVLKLGFVVNFLAHPVVSGFTSAAALIIGFSQLKHLLGVPLARNHHVHAILLDALGRLGEVQPQTIVISLGSIGALVALKKWAPRAPRALAVVGIATGAVALMGLDAAGVAIVGAVPGGLPKPSMPTFDPETLGVLLPTAVTIALVGFMESISVAKVFAARHRARLDPDQELFGLGLANVTAAFFGGYPVTGGFSRSAVNDQAGARTPLAGMVTATMVGLSLLFLTPLFHYMPKASLSAIIVVAVAGLIDLKEAKHLWQVKRSDFGLLVLTFVATLTLGIEQGIVVGVGASLLWFVARRTRPHFAVLGRLPGTDVYRNVLNHPEAETTPGVLAVRFDAAYYFGNVTFLQDTLERLEAETSEPLRAVVLDATSINDLDSSAAHALHDLAEAYQERGIRLVLAGAKGPVREVVKRAHLDALIEQRLTVAEAVRGPAPASSATA